MTTPNVTFLAALRDRPQRSKGANRRFFGESAFWTGAIGMGVGVILSQIGDIDAISASVDAQPARAAGSRPVLGQYIGMVQALARAWPERSRAALMAALAELRSCGEALTGEDAPRLAAALERMGDGSLRACADAARVIEGLIGRLNVPIHALDAINADFGTYLAQMAAASADLENDTVLVTQRLQADHVHAFVLAQQVHTMQARIDEARARLHGHWPLGAHAELLRREIAGHNAALDSARRQLDQIRADQAATMRDAHYLQQLLPTLSSYLAGVDRMSAGINAALSGALALQAQLGKLNQAVLAAPGCGASALVQLNAALPNWRNLAARIAQRDTPPPAR